MSNLITFLVIQVQYISSFRSLGSGYDQNMARLVSTIKMDFMKGLIMGSGASTSIYAYMMRL